jgi:hypothetical protein
MGKTTKGQEEYSLQDRTANPCAKNYGGMNVARFYFTGMAWRLVAAIPRI